MAQKSTIISASNVVYGTSTSTTGVISWRPTATNLRFKIFRIHQNYSVTSDFITPNTMNVVEYTVTFDYHWIEACPNMQNAAVRYILYTYEGDTEIGSDSITVGLLLPTNINPTVSVTNVTKSAQISNNFSVPVTLLDKLSIQFAFNASYRSPMAYAKITSSLLGSANVQSTTFLTSVIPTTSFGTHTVSVKAVDARGNSSSVATYNASPIYQYFTPTLDVKFLKENTDYDEDQGTTDGVSYKLNVSGKVAVVNDENECETLTLKVKDVNGNQKGSTVNLKASGSGITIAKTNGDNHPYDDYYDISGTYVIPVNTLGISDIETTTYAFEVTVTDSVGGSVGSYTKSIYSGITVMTFRAGAEGIDVWKPMHFHPDKGGYPLWEASQKFESGIDLDDVKYPIDAWCYNVTNKPSGASNAYGRLIMPSRKLQLYFEYGGSTSSEIPAMYMRMYTNSTWLPWAELRTAPANSLQYIKTISASSSVDITVSNGYKGIIYAFRGSSTMGQYMVNVSSTGSVNICAIASISNLTTTTSTRKISFSNSSTGTVSIYAIGNDYVS